LRTTGVEHAVQITRLAVEAVKLHTKHGDPTLQTLNGNIVTL